MFQVIRLLDNIVVQDDIATGKEASEIAKAYSEAMGVKYQPRPKPDDSWKAREQARFESGEYTPVPWVDAWWYGKSIGETEHFVHVSKSKPGMVAFTESVAKGMKDIQTRMKPGAYLTRYYAEVLSPGTIQTLARQFAGQFEKLELKMASTPEEIVRVYVNGPNSCMSHKPHEYIGHLHPTYVYGAGDLSVAYLEASEGDVTARALVWPAKKRYGRVYGDGDRLVPLLEAEGYASGDLGGARMLRIENENSEGSLICPYVDWVNKVTDMGDHLLLGDVGGKVYDADSTRGVCSTNVVTCECCGDRMNRINGYVTERDGFVCEGCWNEHSFYCEYSGENYYDTNNAVTVDGELWHIRYARRHATQCDHCGDWTRDRNIINVATRSGSENWCRSCVEDDADVCSDCGEAFARSLPDALNSDGLCKDCAAVEKTEDTEEPEDTSEAVASYNSIAAE